MERQRDKKLTAPKLALISKNKCPITTIRQVLTDSKRNPDFSKFSALSGPSIGWSGNFPFYASLWEEF
jgi:hypothetical protein